MDYGTNYLYTVLLYFFIYIVWGMLSDPQTWEPADITKPDIGHSYGEPDYGFTWAMWANQKE